MAKSLVGLHHLCNRITGFARFPTQNMIGLRKSKITPDVTGHNCIGVLTGVNKYRPDYQVPTQRMP